MVNYREEDAKKTKVLWEKEEKAKYTALWAGIIFFMMLIIFLWLLNTKNLFEYLNFNKKKAFNIDQFSQEFNQSLSDAMSQLGEMKSDAVPPDFNPQKQKENNSQQ